MVPSLILRSFFICAYIFTWVTSARSECDSARLIAICKGSGILLSSYLANDIPSNEQVTVTCSPQTGIAFMGWSHSPDGSTNTAERLDTSLSKYMVSSGNTLTISNINGTDEGLYRCVYSHGQSLQKRCIHVYGKAVFASCPFDGCTDIMSLSVEEGNNVEFDATVIHTPGGSCGFKQEIRSIELVKINKAHGVSDERLLYCDITSNSGTCNSSSVSLNRGNDPGFEFVFTLSRAYIRDSGTYEVVVTTKHPRTGSFNTITKRFDLNIRQRLNTDSPTTFTIDAQTTAPADQDDTTLQTSTANPTSISLSVSSKGNSLSWLPIVVAIVVSVVIVAIVVSIIIFCAVMIKRNRKTSRKTIIEKAYTPQLETNENNRSSAKERFGDETIIPQDMATVVQLRATFAVDNPVVDPVVDPVVELPPPNPRTSMIEPDSTVFDYFDSNVVTHV